MKTIQTEFMADTTLVFLHETNKARRCLTTMVILSNHRLQVEWMTRSSGGKTHPRIGKKQSSYYLTLSMSGNIKNKLT